MFVLPSINLMMKMFCFRSFWAIKFLSLRWSVVYLHCWRSVELETFTVRLLPELFMMTRFFSRFRVEVKIMATTPCRILMMNQKEFYKIKSLFQRKYNPSSLNQIYLSVLFPLIIRRECTGYLGLSRYSGSLDGLFYFTTQKASHFVDHIL